MVKTKIICTLGPASSGVTMLRRMMLAGMDVARLNCSHGTLAEHDKRIGIITQLNKKYRRRIKILLDLEGHRIRIGKFKNAGGIELKKRHSVILSNNALRQEDNVIPFDYRGSLLDIRTGTHLYIDDGNIDLIVKKAAKNYLKAEVAVGGILKEHKGVNIPDIHLKFEGLTDKDRTAIAFGVDKKVDYIAQSFVRYKSDIDVIRDSFGDSLSGCKLIAKIENREGIKNIDSILSVSDGIMVARGDMGVSLPIYEIPIVQKEIISKCNKAHKFVITATQMLESMVENQRPTRAEVTDVANAIFDGSDYLMLSAETAVGTHPAKVVEMMNQIIKFTEKNRR
jgi:pyruvate kinase